jgi:hypothetical protein
LEGEKLGETRCGGKIVEGKVARLAPGKYWELDPKNDESEDEGV